jgi:multidrug efflux system membrane fusion protein
VRKRLIMLAVLVPLGAAATWYGLNGSAAPARPVAGTKNADSAVPVMIAAARREDVPVYLTGLGTVTAYNSVLIRSRVDGQILKLDFSEGQEVHAGDTLVEIDQKPLKALLSQAQAGMVKDEAQLANAKLDLTRATQLASSGSVTRQQLDAARALADQIEASTKVDEAVIDAAEVQLGYTTIRTQIDGRVGTRLVDAGNLVRANDTTGIVIVNQIKPIFVAFDLPSDSLPEVRAKMKAGDLSVAAVDNHGKDLATGRLTVVDNHVDTTTATVRYKADFENADEVLWPGQFVGIRLQLDTRRNAITVPSTAIEHGPDGAYVFVVDANHIVGKRPVVVGLVNGGVTAVDEGLQPGEQVITDGQYRVQEGTTVSILPASGTASVPSS